jgi:hypothetical protein
MKQHPVFSILPKIVMAVILIMGCMPVLVAQADAPTAYTFSAFNTTTFFNEGAPATKSLEVSGVPAADYLFFTVVGDFKHGTPNSEWSNYVYLEITNGASIIFYPQSKASQGALQSDTDTTLYWSGVLFREYTGGGNLSINFYDTDTETGGPYTCTMENVVVKIYPSPITSTTFASFNTGTMTSGGAAVSQSLDVSHVPPDGYLFYTVSADWVHGSPNSAWSNSMKLQINNGASTVYYSQNPARSGALESDADTTLYWSGPFDREYTGGGNLTIKFIDTDTSSGGPFTSSLQNVTVSIYPSPTIPKTFTSFNTPDITGGGAGYTQALDISGLAADDYLFYTVVADYKDGVKPAWSSTMEMQFNDGASIFYCGKIATQGTIQAAGDTTLYWSGVFDRKYTGGGNLSIKFQDPSTDENGPYNSHLENVRVSIFRGAGTGVTAVDLTSLAARSGPLSSIRSLFSLLKDVLFPYLK